jgi:hypothetical protein
MDWMDVRKIRGVGEEAGGVGFWRGGCYGAFFAEAAEELGERIVSRIDGWFWSVVPAEFGVQRNGAELVGKSEVETAFCRLFHLPKIGVEGKFGSAGADDAGEKAARFDVGEEIGIGQRIGFLAERVEFGLDMRLLPEARAVAAGSVVVGAWEGVEIRGFGAGAGEEAVDEFAMALGELHGG